MSKCKVSAVNESSYDTVFSVIENGAKERKSSKEVQRVLVDTFALSDKETENLIVLWNNKLYMDTRRIFPDPVVLLRKMNSYAAVSDRERDKVRPFISGALNFIHPQSLSHIGVPGIKSFSFLGAAMAMAVMGGDFNTFNTAMELMVGKDSQACFPFPLESKEPSQ